MTDPENPTTCTECGNIYDAAVTRGCPLCGYGSRDSGRVRWDTDTNGHKETVADVVDAHGPVSMCDLYARYQAVTDDPRAKRTVRRYLRQLGREGEIDVRGDKRGRVYAPATA